MKLKLRMISGNDTKTSPITFKFKSIPSRIYDMGTILSRLGDLTLATPTFSRVGQDSRCHDLGFADRCQQVPLSIQGLVVATLDLKYPEKKDLAGSISCTEEDEGLKEKLVEEMDESKVLENEEDLSECYDGDDEPKWALYCWKMCRGTGETGQNFTRECLNHGANAKTYGICSGSMNKVLRNWDEHCFYSHNFGYAETLVIKSCLGEYVPPEKPHICVELQKAMQKSRKFERESQIEYTTRTSYGHDFNRRQKPTFSKYNRNREARDYRVFSAPKYPPRNSLMGLPAEVRLMILENLFSDLRLESWNSVSLLRARFGPWNFTCRPLSILITCRELYFEGHKFFQTKTLFKSRLDMVDSHRAGPLFTRPPTYLPCTWNPETFQKMLPNVKRWHIEIKNPEYKLFIPNRTISWVPRSYESLLKDLIENQAKEALRNGNTLNELTVELQAGRGCSTYMSDFYMKRHAISALLAFKDKVKVMRIIGEIPESLKDFARSVEIEIQGYDDTPPPPPPPMVEAKEKEEAEVEAMAT